MKWIDYLTRGIAVIILGQTLYFKFSAAPESVFIFSAIGVEPWGRILSGIIELIVCLLLLIPITASTGALVGAMTMAGAIMAHVAKLGIVVQGDGGLLFAMAGITLICCSYSAWYHRRGLAWLFKPLRLFQS